MNTWFVCTKYGLERNQVAFDIFVFTAEDGDGGNVVWLDTPGHTNIWTGNEGRSGSG